MAKLVRTSSLKKVVNFNFSLLLADQSLKTETAYINGHHRGFEGKRRQGFQLPPPPLGQMPVDRKKLHPLLPPIYRIFQTVHQYPFILLGEETRCQMAH